MNKKTIAFIACALAVIGSFMPWATVTTGFGNIDIAGTNGDGVLTIILAIAIAVCVAIGLQKTALYVVALLASALGVVTCVVDMSNVSNAESEVVQSSVGIGLFLCLIAFVGTTVYTILLRKELKNAVKWPVWGAPTDSYSTPQS